MLFSVILDTYLPLSIYLFTMYVGYKYALWVR